MVTDNKLPISLLFIFFLILLILPSNLAAHHGWGWATSEEFEITGKIVEIRLGNPHGEVDLLVENAVWVVEVGQPWRNSRVDLTDNLVKGRVITVHGHRSANADVRLVKAERVVIDGEDYNLYPNRES
ncbi:MAG: hypothetical protein QNJ17_09335 [Desulfocapsaceae bacterium]|nr:hypothetical protein [Desulfocapsaceae bacterium]